MLRTDLEQSMPFLDSKGRYRTASLFWEFKNKNYSPIYSLSPKDKGECPSLHQIYLELSTAPIDGEYEFAMAAFGSWKQWTRICENTQLRAYIDEWRDELEVKVRSKAIKSLVETAAEEGSKGTAAAKWVAGGQWKTGKGRPTKAQVEHRKKIEAGIHSDTDEDAQRLGLH